MAGATIAPTLPAIEEAFQYVNNSAFWTQMMLTFPAIAIVIMSPFAGIITDTFGRKELLIFSLFIYAIAGTAGLYVTDISILLGSRVLLGVGVAGIMITVTTLIGDYFQGEERSAFLGKQSSFMALGGVVYISSGGFLADISWRSPFWLYGIPLLLIPLAITTIDRNIGKAMSSELKMTLFAYLKKEKRIWFIIINVWVCFLIFYLIPLQLPFYLKSSLELSNSMIGIIISISTITGALTSFNYHRFAYRISEACLFRFSFIMVSLAYLILFITQSREMTMLAMAVSGLGLGLVMPNANVWALRLAPLEIRGKVVGAITIAVFTGQFTSPLLIYLLKTYLNELTIFRDAAILLLLFVLISYLYTRKRL